MTKTQRKIDWRRALVYGLGTSGVAASRLLRSQGVEVIGVDRREMRSLELGVLGSDSRVDLRLGVEPIELPSDIDGIVVSPGVPMDRPLLVSARKLGVPVIAEVELGFIFADGPIIGITGSNGKSTTTAMTGALLEGAGIAAEICGNIGVPLTAVLGRPGRPVYVTELSSFQLEAIDTFHPKAAALLNVADDHLDRHRDSDAYLAAKLALFSNLEPEDVAVLNADDSRVADLTVRGRRRFFSRVRSVDDGCFLEGDQVIEVDPDGGRKILFCRQDLSLAGAHNLENAMAAALLSRAAGADPSSFASTLVRFQGLPHRLQAVRESGGVRWYDDSKATNFAATLKSLEGFADGSVHLILGGRNKGGDPAVLAEMIGRKVRRLYLVGEAAEEMAAVFRGSVSTEMAHDMTRAVSSAASHADSGEVVLLSPACASFDQYQSFSERGVHFQGLARAVNG
jgi:UDP-N-acetylmuramoylalanine--D-glutamate ligase